MEFQIPPRLSSDRNKNHKWYILMFLSTIFLATYHCISGISALESEVISLFNLSHAEFALLSSIVFGCAIFGALVSPYIIDNHLTLSQLLLTSCLLIVVGQSLFVFACATVFQSLIVLYFARILIGFAYGFQTVSVFCIVYRWFSDTQWLPLATYLILVTFDVGLIVGKYALLPMYKIFYDSISLSIAFSVGIALALLSAIACCIILRMESNLNIVGVQLDRDLSKARHFSLHTWLLIIAILIPSAFLDITGTLMTQPLMNIFNLTESHSDMILSIIPLLDISLGFVFAWLASSFGYLSFYLVCSPILYCMAYAIMYLSVNDSFLIGIVSMIAFAFATEAWFAASYASLFLSCHPEYISILNAVVSILRLSASMLGCFMFGFIEDSENESDRRLPILMMIVLAGLLLVITTTIFILDCVKGSDGLLHLSWKQREERNSRKFEFVREMTLVSIPETEPLLD